ncbi:S8 family serine peptidase [Bacillus sp. EB01]|uniref:S8 family serine peptidase n=1 Tax=Bacillus sp. EB01 TaxID=1347086 RepID=UPI0005C4446C|nr:S8 family serine peptidase [Bacillus sp. EB01]
MRKLTVAMFLILLLCEVQKSEAAISVPPLPEEDPKAIESGIVIMKEKATEDEIRRLLKRYPSVKLRYVFSESIYGFSLEGNHGEILKLEKEAWVETFSPIKTYKSETLTQELNRTNSIDKDYSVSSYPLLINTQQRLTGRGVSVGVIDTGIDYTHPDLRRAYRGGWDFVDHDADPMETKGGSGASTIHGTHVAGIIAANGKMRGIAPDAMLRAYRALGPGGTGTSELVLAAIDQAIKDKVDILNLSLGNDVNGPDLPISVALNKAVEKGVVAVVSNGNSGPGQWTVGAPGTSSKAISVGASTPLMKVPYILIEGTNEKMKLETMAGSEQWKSSPSFDLTDGGYGTEHELRQSKNKVALIKRGKLTFAQKVQNALRKGAKGVIIYNNVKGGFAGNLNSTAPFPVSSITNASGEHLLSRLIAGKDSARIIFKEESNLLAPFSSRGPVTGTWEIKPDVVAPGVAISSTVPGGYLQLNGTSMAAPYVAGVCALIKQAHPEWTPQEIKAALMNTALPLHQKSGKDYKTFEQGAGRVQPEKAASHNVLVMPGSITFGKMPRTLWKSAETSWLTIKNVGSGRVRVAFSIPPSQAGLDWRMPLPFELGPGEKKAVSITLRIDPDELKGKIAEGAFSLQAGDNKIRVPYIFAYTEPDYPRVMGFEFAEGDAPGNYLYEVYLPGGAEEFGIALFRKSDYTFSGFLDYGRRIERGYRKRKIVQENLPGPGLYIAKIFARKAGKEDMVETIIQIEP